MNGDRLLHIRRLWSEYQALLAHGERDPEKPWAVRDADRLFILTFQLRESVGELLAHIEKHEAG